ncbi:MAG: hypothetical protein MHMPM18_002577, partial [Marteilia pararefringens]
LSGNNSGDSYDSSDKGSEPSVDPGEVVVGKEDQVTDNEESETGEQEGNYELSDIVIRYEHNII